MHLSGPLIVLVATLFISVISFEKCTVEAANHTDPLPAQLQLRTSIMESSSSGSGMISGMMADTLLDTVYVLNWRECIICQQSTTEDLRCPCNDLNPSQTPGAVYEAFAGRFQAVKLNSGLEPMKEHFKLHHLFDHSTLPDIVAEMLSKQGKWHKGCYLQFNTKQVARLSSRKRLPSDTRPHSVALTDPEPTDLVGLPDPGGSLTDGRPRKSLRAALKHDPEKCIFCQENSSDSLRNVETATCGTRFYELASALESEPLLTILTYAEQGKKAVEHDMKYHDTCRTLMFNKYKSHIRNQPSLASDPSVTDQPAMLAGRAFFYLTHHLDQMVEDGTYNITFPELVLLHNHYRETLGLQIGISEQVLKEKLGLHFENEADWVKCDGKTYSLCFESCLGC